VPVVASSNLQINRQTDAEDTNASRNPDLARKLLAQQVR
jgi:hypothetical protein